MEKPSREFTYKGNTYSLSAPVPRVGTQMVNNKCQELLDKYINGVSEISQYGNESFGEIGSTQYVRFKTDNPHSLIEFVRSHSYLEPINGEAIFAGTGLINQVKLIKPNDLVKKEVEALQTEAEALVREDVEGFKKALSEAKKAYVEDYEAFKAYQREQERLAIEAEAEEDEFLRSLQ
ncbi:hypothetical protein [Neptuniibacter caesariensis]|uniref:Uncharacterized protein n=1 Tax=Neptuniibacter caesariensis TaxID=207954 RepID=A0A7U8C7G5_NEPCE|nr:hypothetical protein [Neptuniibacter caesariensis]EAR62963.1 hypothetical protein MED92_07586 [Oceanospirillum sp. MED92] [Neptuniibacter caesariensis]